MPAEDFRINRLVNGVLTRHWVDTTKLKYQTSRGTVRFSGVLASTDGRTSKVDASLLEVIVAEVRGLKGVDKVYLTGVEMEGAQAKRKAGGGTRATTDEETEPQKQVDAAP